MGFCRSKNAQNSIIIYLLTLVGERLGIDVFLYFFHGFFSRRLSSKRRHRRRLWCFGCAWGGGYGRFAGPLLSEDA